MALYNGSESDRLYWSLPVLAIITIIKLSFGAITWAYMLHAV